jgi:hypothetical protein
VLRIPIESSDNPYVDNGLKTMGKEKRGKKKGLNLLREFKK